jgi:homoserine dehydrogenase
MNATSNRTPVILIGFGKVGRELAHQIQTVPKAKALFKLIAVADSSAFIANTNGISEQQIEKLMELKVHGRALSTAENSQSPDDLLDLIQPDTLVVDTSASKSMKEILINAAEKGAKLAFANKNTLCEDWTAVQTFFRNPKIKYESAVGAGLPAIETLNYLLDTGDTIIRIEGCMSGTLGFLTSQLEAGVSYSEAVKSAYEKGYTEPDPRDDLSGFDVARKALILARTAGWAMEMADVTIEKLYSEEMATGSIEAFLEATSSLDFKYTKLVEAARSNNKVLRYVAVVTPQSADVGLQAVPKDSSLGSLTGPGNMISFTTERYQDIPLTISGPGAGIEVTAAGVLGDLIKLSDEPKVE